MDNEQYHSLAIQLKFTALQESNAKTQQKYKFSPSEVVIYIIYIEALAYFQKYLPKLKRIFIHYFMRCVRVFLNGM